MSLKYGFTAREIIKQGRVTQQAIDDLKVWAKLQDGVPQLTDEQVVHFLLCCDDPERTKNTIKNFYSVRKAAPNVFDSREITREDLQHQLKIMEFCVFPKRTPDNCVVMFHRVYDTYYSNYRMEPSMKLYFMTLDAAIYDAPPAGLIVLFDMKGVGLLHLTRVRLHLLKVFFQYLQEAVPVKVKAVHVLNSVYFIDKVMAIIKPFINAALLSLVTFHSSSLKMEDFYANCIPKQCLPEDLGGELPNVRVLHERNTEKLTEMQDYFDAEERQRHNLLD